VPVQPVDSPTVERQRQRRCPGTQRQRAQCTNRADGVPHARYGGHKLSQRICVAEWMISDSNGTAFAQSWLPTMVAERMATSGKDGNVDRSPDQIPFIDSEILWTNTDDDP